MKITIKKLWYLVLNKTDCQKKYSCCVGVNKLQNINYFNNSHSNCSINTFFTHKFDQYKKVKICRIH